MTMRRLWLIFAQTVTVSLAVVFVLGTFRPEWLGKPNTNETQKTSEPQANSASFREAAKKALPAVVHIATSKKAEETGQALIDDPFFRHFFGDTPEADDEDTAGLCSGVIVIPSGYILTNFHVVEGADEIKIGLDDGRSLKARVIGGDPESDLAVLQATPAKPDEPLELPAISFGDQTVTMGIVSALGRSHLGINTFENFIQTDAAINPGNSGGALIDAKGNLVGINTAIYSRSGGSLGIGFAIPVSTAKNVMEQIIQTGSVTRGWIGIEAQEITPELAESFGLAEARGALVAGVQRGGPADLGGVKPGDILLAVNGKVVKDPQVMLDLIASQKPGETIPFQLQRQKATFDTTIRIGKRPLPRRERN